MMVVAAIVLATGLISRTTMESDVPVHDPATSSWRRRGPAPADTLVSLTVQIAVEPEAREKLESIFWAVSEPDNERYGKHLSIEAISDVLSVPDARVERVRSFFHQHGATEVVASPYKDVLSVRMSCANVERALQTSLGAYEHADRPEVGAIIRATQSYSLPEEIAADVRPPDSNLTAIPPPHSKRTRHQRDPLGARVAGAHDWRAASVSSPPPARGQALCRGGGSGVVAECLQCECLPKQGDSCGLGYTVPLAKRHEPGRASQLDGRGRVPGPALQAGRHCQILGGVRRERDGRP